MCNDNVTPRKTKNEFSYAQKVQERGLNHYPLRSSECFWEKRCPFLILRTRGNRQDEWTSDVDAMMMICTLLLMPIPPPLTDVFSRHILLHPKVPNMLRKVGEKQLLKMIIPLRICHASAPNPSKKRTYDCKMWSIFWHTWEELHAYTHTFKQNEQ